MQSTASYFRQGASANKTVLSGFPVAPRSHTNPVRQSAPVANKVNVAGSGTGTSSTPSGLVHLL